ncbi:deoxynucleotidyltransferase terminal-interacting protein 2 [Triplophysa rosa]|uniref:Deoxynucleotidyltransferase terminal-interacting protein 2 n=2 Tax=Triplophysa rosa TaxID=992332 RepID=A0A9W7WGC3_TRIRA|nr:deoxynucleotidyltransferase terminal-interacting protein 2 [Triplophysa rosa]
MVATRSETRVGSPVKNINDETSGVTVPAPSTRTTRHRSVMEEKHSQSELTGDSQPDEEKDESTAPSLPASPPKREIRRSMRLLTDKKQPDSTHDADVSESESCCSVTSDVKATPRTRRRTVTREKPKTPAKNDVSEAESCSSAVSPTRSRRAPRSLRKRVQTPAVSDPPKTNDGDLSEAGSCSSVVSLTKVLDTRRITRSRRRTAMLAAELDPSDPDSCSSNVSGLRGSVVRRSARNQKGKPTEPIPLNLEETTDSPSSPVSRRLRDRRGRTKSEPAKEACDSDECMSGPSTSPWRSRRRQVKRDTVGESDSESVPTDVCTSQDSTSSLKGRGTPCSSRTGSASSNRAVPITRTRSKASVTMVQEERECEERKPLPLQCESVVTLEEEDIEKPVDSTMTDTGKAQECTVTEETTSDITLVLDPDVSAESSLHADVEILEPQSTPETVCAVSVSENADSETQAHQETAVDEMAATVAMDGDVAMENNEPEFVKANRAVEDQANCDAVDADPEAPGPSAVEKNATDVEETVVCAKDVVVTKDANEMFTASMDEMSVLLKDAESEERPSSSTHTQSDLTTAEQPFKRSPPLKEMTSLLDSSEDEESPDEGLSADEEEEEGASQEAVDGVSDEEIKCPDEGQSMVEAQSSGLFVIDTRPGLSPDEKYYVDAKQIQEEEEDEDFVDEEGDDDNDDDDEDSQVLFAPKRPVMHLSTSIDTGLKVKDLGGLYISFDGKQKSLSSGLKTQKNQSKVDELLKKSVIVPDFEKKDAIPPYRESKHAAKLKRKAEREKTTGDGWFNMKAPELTEELRNDLKALKMRSAMDPKRFYKKNDREGFPKYFQVGTVVDSPVDFYSSRIPKKQRKRTIVEELLADAEFRSNNKKKYQEIMTEKAAQVAGKMYKKHKFHKKKTNKS